MHTRSQEQGEGTEAFRGEGTSPVLARGRCLTRVSSWLYLYLLEHTWLPCHPQCPLGPCFLVGTNLWIVSAHPRTLPLTSSHPSSTPSLTYPSIYSLTYPPSIQPPLWTAPYTKKGRQWSAARAPHQQPGWQPGSSSRWHYLVKVPRTWPPALEPHAGMCFGELGAKAIHLSL